MQVQYTYDAIGRLTGTVHTSGQQVGYTYDAAGNMVGVAHNGVVTGDAALLLTTSGPGGVARNPVGSVVGDTGGTLSVDYTSGTALTLTAQSGSGASFIGWGGACSGAALSCNLTMDQARSVVAAFAAGSGAGGGDAGGVPMPGTGTASVSGPLPGGGQVGVVASGGSGAGGCAWVFTEAEVLTAPPGVALPAGYTFPYGLVSFELALGAPGSTANVVLTYPEILPPNAVYMKYGRTQGNLQPHWYVFSGASINGNTVTLSLQDGGAGDHDLLPNGVIADPGGVAVAEAPGLEQVPALSPWSLLLLLIASAGMGVGTLLRRPH